MAQDIDDESADLPGALRDKSFVRSGIYDAPAWYDVDYAGYLAELPFYWGVAARHVHDGGCLVELGAGTGRLTLPLARAGHRVHAVEPAAAMRATLQRRLDSETGSVSVEDARADSFLGPAQGRVDVVMFAFNGILHVSTRDQLHACFAHVHRRLADDGRFALDHTGPYWDAVRLLQPRFGRADRRVHPETGRGLWTCDRSRLIGPQRLRIDIRFAVDDEETGTEIELVQTLWTWQQMAEAWTAAGFAVDELYGDVNLQPFSEGSPRMLVSLRKA
jgi:SAM-dependent methyltransferase